MIDRPTAPLAGIEPDDSSPTGSGPPVPKGRDVLLTGLVVLLLPIVLAVGWLVLVATGLLPKSLWPMAIPIAAASEVVGLATLMRRRGWGWRELGFTRTRRSLWHLLWEVPAILLGSVVIAMTLGHLLGISPEGTKASELTEGTTPGWLLLAVAAAGVILVPLAEEIFFRRMLLDWLRARMPVAAAAVLSGVLFGLVHVAPAAVLYIAPAGVGLAWLRLRHGTLWASFIGHATNNAIVAAGVLAALR